MKFNPYLKKNLPYNPPKLPSRETSKEDFFSEAVGIDPFTSATSPVSLDFGRFCTAENGTELFRYKIPGDGSCLFGTLFAGFVVYDRNPGISDLKTFRRNLAQWLTEPKHKQAIKDEIISAIKNPEVILGSFAKIVADEIKEFRTQLGLVGGEYSQIKSAVDTYLEKEGINDYITALGFTNQWGGELELDCIAEKMGFCFKVYEYSEREEFSAKSWKTHGTATASQDNVIYLAFNGTHFDLLVPKDDTHEDQVKRYDETSQLSQKGALFSIEDLFIILMNAFNQKDSEPKKVSFANQRPEFDTTPKSHTDIRRGLPSISTGKTTSDISATAPLNAYLSSASFNALPDHKKLSVLSSIVAALIQSSVQGFSADEFRINQKSLAVSFVPSVSLAEGHRESEMVSLGRLIGKLSKAPIFKHIQQLCESGDIDLSQLKNILSVLSNEKNLSRYDREGSKELYLKNISQIKPETPKDAFGLPALYGRSHQLQDVTTALNEWRGGFGFVGIRAEKGLGKSAVLHHAEHIWKDNGVDSFLISVDFSQHSESPFLTLLSEVLNLTLDSKFFSSAKYYEDLVNAFQKALEVKPLALFLDNLDQADPLSILLISTLLKLEPKLANLLIVCTYTAPVSKELAYVMGNTDLGCNQLVLNPLSKDEVQRLLADTFHLPPDKFFTATVSLNENPSYARTPEVAVLDRIMVLSNGNPLIVSNILTALITAKERIKSSSLTLEFSENFKPVYYEVIENRSGFYSCQMNSSLILSLLNDTTIDWASHDPVANRQLRTFLSQSADNARILKAAALLGRQFKVTDLASIISMDARVLEDKILQPALKQGILQKLSEYEYCFASAEFRSVCRAEMQWPELLLHVADYLTENIHQESFEGIDVKLKAAKTELAKLYLSCPLDHFARFKVDTTRLQKISAILYTAYESANEAKDYGAAYEFIDKAIQILGMIKNPTTSMQGRINRYQEVKLEFAHNLSKTDEGIRTAELLLQNTTPSKENAQKRAKLYYYMALFYIAQSKPEDALKCFESAHAELKQIDGKHYFSEKLGKHLKIRHFSQLVLSPKKSNVLSDELSALRSSLITELDPESVQSMIQSMRLAFQMVSATEQVMNADANAMVVNTLHMIDMALQQNYVSPQMAFFIAVYALVYTIKGHHEDMKPYYKFATELLENNTDIRTRGLVRGVVYGFCGALFENVSNEAYLKQLQQAFSEAKLGGQGSALIGVLYGFYVMYCRTHNVAILELSSIIRHIQNTPYPKFADSPLFYLLYVLRMRYPEKDAARMASNLVNVPKIKVEILEICAKNYPEKQIEHALGRKPKSKENLSEFLNTLSVEDLLILVNRLRGYKDTSGDGVALKIAFLVQFGRYKEAYDLKETYTAKMHESKQKTLIDAMATFFLAIAAVEMGKDVKLKDLESLAKYQPENFNGFYLLLTAETEKSLESAHEKYQQAIKWVEKTGPEWLLPFIYERLAKRYLDAFQYQSRILLYQEMADVFSAIAIEHYEQQSAFEKASYLRTIYKESTALSSRDMQLDKLRKLLGEATKQPAVVYYLLKSLLLTTGAIRVLYAENINDTWQWRKVYPESDQEESLVVPYQSISQFMQSDVFDSPMMPGNDSTLLELASQNKRAKHIMFYKGLNGCVVMLLNTPLSPESASEVRHLIQIASLALYNVHIHVMDGELNKARSSASDSIQRKTSLLASQTDLRGSTELRIKTISRTPSMVLTDSPIIKKESLKSIEEINAIKGFSVQQSKEVLVFSLVIPEFLLLNKVQSLPDFQKVTACFDLIDRFVAEQDVKGVRVVASTQSYQLYVEPSEQSLVFLASLAKAIQALFDQYNQSVVEKNLQSLQANIKKINREILSLPYSQIKGTVLEEHIALDPESQEAFNQKQLEKSAIVKNLEVDPEFMDVVAIQVALSKKPSSAIALPEYNQQFLNYKLRLQKLTLLQTQQPLLQVSSKMIIHQNTAHFSVLPLVGSTVFGPVFDDIQSMQDAVKPGAVLYGNSVKPPATLLPLSIPVAESFKTEDSSSAISDRDSLKESEDYSDTPSSSSLPEQSNFRTYVRKLTPSQVSEISQSFDPSITEFNIRKIEGQLKEMKEASNSLEYKYLSQLLEFLKKEVVILKGGAKDPVAAYYALMEKAGDNIYIKAIAHLHLALYLQKHDYAAELIEAEFHMAISLYKEVRFHDLAQSIPSLRSRRESVSEALSADNNRLVKLGSAYIVPDKINNVFEIPRQFEYLLTQFYQVVQRLVGKDGLSRLTLISVTEGGNPEKVILDSAFNKPEPLYLNQSLQPHFVPLQLINDMLGKQALLPNKKIVLVRVAPDRTTDEHYFNMSNPVLIGMPGAVAVFGLADSKGVIRFVLYLESNQPDGLNALPHLSGNAVEINDLPFLLARSIEDLAAVQTKVTAIYTQANQKTRMDTAVLKSIFNPQLLQAYFDNNNSFQVTSGHVAVIQLHVPFLKQRGNQGSYLSLLNAVVAKINRILVRYNLQLKPILFNQTSIQLTVISVNDQDHHPNQAVNLLAAVITIETFINQTINSALVNEQDRISMAVYIDSGDMAVGYTALHSKPYFEALGPVISAAQEQSFPKDRFEIKASKTFIEVVQTSPYSYIFQFSDGLLSGCVSQDLRSIRTQTRLTRTITPFSPNLQNSRLQDVEGKSARFRRKSVESEEGLSSSDTEETSSIGSHHEPEETELFVKNDLESAVLHLFRSRDIISPNKELWNILKGVFASSSPSGLTTILFQNNELSLNPGSFRTLIIKEARETTKVIPLAQNPGTGRIDRSYRPTVAAQAPFDAFNHVINKQRLTLWFEGKNIGRLSRELFADHLICVFKTTQNKRLAEKILAVTGPDFSKFKQMFMLEQTVITPAHLALIPYLYTVSPAKSDIPCTIQIDLFFFNMFSAGDKEDVLNQNERCFVQIMQHKPPYQMNTLSVSLAAVPMLVPPYAVICPLILNKDSFHPAAVLSPSALSKLNQLESFLLSDSTTVSEQTTVLLTSFITAALSELDSKPVTEKIQLIGLIYQAMVQFLRKIAEFAEVKEPGHLFDLNFFNQLKIELEKLVKKDQKDFAVSTLIKMIKTVGDQMDAVHNEIFKKSATLIRKEIEELQKNLSKAIALQKKYMQQKVSLKKDDPKRLKYDEKIQQQAIIVQKLSSELKTKMSDVQPLLIALANHGFIADIELVLSKIPFESWAQAKDERGNFLIHKIVDSGNDTLINMCLSLAKESNKLHILLWQVDGFGRSVFTALCQLRNSRYAIEAVTYLSQSGNTSALYVLLQLQEKDSPLPVTVAVTQHKTDLLDVLVRAAVQARAFNAFRQLSKEVLSGIPKEATSFLSEIQQLAFRSVPVTTLFEDILKGNIRDEDLKFVVWILTRALKHHLIGLVRSFTREDWVRSVIPKDKLRAKALEALLKDKVNNVDWSGLAGSMEGKSTEAVIRELLPNLINKEEEISNGTVKEWAEKIDKSVNKLKAMNMVFDSWSRLLKHRLMTLSSEPEQFLKLYGLIIDLAAEMVAQHNFHLGFATTASLNTAFINSVITAFEKKGILVSEINTLKEKHKKLDDIFDAQSNYKNYYAAVSGLHSHIPAISVTVGRNLTFAAESGQDAVNEVLNVFLAGIDMLPTLFDGDVLNGIVSYILDEINALELQFQNVDYEDSMWEQKDRLTKS